MMFVLFSACYLLAHSSPQKDYRPMVVKIGKPFEVAGGVWRAPLTFGKQTAVCVLDTGSPHSYLRPRLLKELQDPTSKDTAAGTLAQVSASDSAWMISFFEPANQSMLKAMDRQHIDGVIGFDGLREASFVWSNRGKHLDFPMKKYRRLGDMVGQVTGGKKNGAVEIVPLDITDDAAYVTAIINGVPGRFTIGTGVPHCLLGQRLVSTAGLSNGDRVTVQLSPGLTYSASAVLAPKVVADENHPTFGSEGVLSCQLNAIADRTALDLRDSAFLAPAALPSELKTSSKLTRYAMLPGRVGPLIVAPSAANGYVKVFCPLTRTTFEVPADSPIPLFGSTDRAIQDVKDKPRVPLVLALGPGQVAPEGWLQGKPSGTLAFAYAPIGKVYVPAGSETFGSGWVREDGPNDGSVFSPNGAVDAASTPFSVMVARADGQCEIKMGSDAPIEIPAGWSFACPKDWTITTSEHGRVLVIPRGVNPKAKVAQLPPWGTMHGYHGLYYSSISQWTEVPDYLAP